MKLNEMNLVQKIGQLLVTGFPAGEINEDFARLVREYSVGNVILFRYNQISRPQLQALCGELNRLVTEQTGIPPLISSDEEGGVVSRLPGDMGKMPSAMAQASLADPERVKRAAYLTGKELLDVGVNFNLAPVLDINNNPSNPVIGVRSYGRDSETVCQYALAALEGYEEAGVLTSGKHFPGHGDTTTDSHLALPVINKSLEELESAELIPFRQAIAQGIPAITIAHILFPALEPGVPATMSKGIITGLLRRTLGFRGLAVSDCMEMNAIKETVGVAKGTVEAVKAGMDLIFISRSPDEVMAAAEALEKAVLTGELPLKRIDDAVGRILDYKKKYLRDGAECTEQERQAIRAFGKKFSRDAIFASRKGPSERFSLGKFPLFLSPLRAQQTLAFNTIPEEYSFAEAMRGRFGGTAVVIDLDLDDGERKHVFTLAMQSSSIVLGTVNGTVHPGQMALARLLVQTGKPFALVALRNPFELEDRPGDCFALALYEYSPDTVEQAMDLFCGDGE